MRIVVGLIVLCICAYAGYEAVRIGGLLGKSRTLVANAVAYQGSSGFTSILVLGDSTAVGVGASSPDDSIPALLARSLGASVENQAVSGAVTGDMEAQLQRAQQGRYDLILIQVGANDIVGLRSLDAANTQMQALLRDALQYSDHIVILTAGRVGDAPMIPSTLTAFFNARAARLQALFMATAAAENVAYVDLSGTPSDTFASDPSKYYAADMFHPSSAGYAVWFSALKQTISSQWPELVYGQ